MRNETWQVVKDCLWCCSAAIVLCIRLQLGTEASRAGGGGGDADDDAARKIDRVEGARGGRKAEP